MSVSSNPTFKMDRLSENRGIYTYSVGDMRVTALHDGQFNCPTAGLVVNATGDDVAAALREAHLPEQHLPITFTAVVIERQGRLTVVDTGYGDIGPPSAGRFTQAFAAAGFEPAAVSRVVLSHLHPDHIGGLNPTGGSRVFPDAEIMVPAAEWSFWTSDEARARATDSVKVYFEKVARVLKPQQERISTFGAGEVSPGLTAIEAFGHTPGHMAFAIASGSESLLLMSDVTNHPALFARNPNWQSMFDIDPVMARETRHRMLDMAATDRVRVSFYHAPFPATGHIDRITRASYEFIPAQWSLK